MESFKTLINALRALLGGLDAKIADVKGGLARVWDWIDGLAWVARSTTIERLPETTVHFEGTWNGDQQITASLGATINTTGFTPGQQYTVYYDGKPYSMYYYVADGGKAFVYDLDNLAYGGDFMLAGSAGEWAVRITGGVSGEACDESHTFYIPAETKAEEKLPDVFLDMDWIPKAQAVDLLTGYVLAEHEDIVYSESEMVRLNRELFEIIEGEKYTVIWGGGTYSCTGLSIAVDSLTIPFIGNASIQDLGDDTGEPFLICKYPDEYASMGMVMAIFAADKETLTALASSPLTVRQTRLELPEDMLPSSVKVEIAGKLDAKNPSGEGYFEMNPFTDLDTGKRVTPGEGSFNVGWRGSAEGRWATNIGSGSAAGGYSVCIGSGEAKAYESTAIGGGITEVNDENDSISEKNGHHSIAIGVGATAARPYQVVVGKYNVINDFNSKDEYIYILGKGSFIDERSNAHTIDNKGNGWFSGEVYVGSTGGVNRDEGSVKLLKDGGDGNGTSLTATHTAATSRAALTSGEKLGVALGKIAKWLADLGSLAFKSTVGKSDLDTELTEKLDDLDDTVVRYDGSTLATIGGVAVPIEGGSGGGSSVVVDTALNETSPNPVQNSAIYAALEKKASKSHTHSADDITDGTLPLARGGTGASTAEAARTNFDVYSKTEVDDAITNAIGSAIAASY